MKMSVFPGLYFLLFCATVFAGTQQKDRPNVEPEYLDKLLAEQRYEEFSYLMGIESSDLAKPTKISNVNPKFHENLFEGDILLDPNSEEARQGIRFDRYPGSRWPGKPAIVPYSISSQFSQSDRQTIVNAIGDWNGRVQCVKINPRRGENDYVQIFPGDGCYSAMGRTRGQQSLSLGRGCVDRGTVLHEFEHAIGISHEHNRGDRDMSVEVLWNNIPQNWRSQYRKNDDRTYGIQSNYDYYSIMHYPMKAPGTNRDAFRIKRNGIDTRRIGRGDDFTATDLEKIRILYC